MFKSHLIILLLISSLRGGLLANVEILECKFTEDLCQWEDLGWDGWVLSDYGSSGFGQPAKQIENDGFIYAKGPTKKSVLMSPILHDKEPFCLYFNYFMFGLSVGSLELQLESVIGADVSKFNQNGQTVWRQEGSKYDDWILGKYHFDPLQHNGDMFRLKFVATSDDIALSSISVKPGSCDFDYKCDFEDPSLCFWLIEPDYKSNFRWFVSNGSNSQHDLVGYDATTNTEAGHFMRTPTNGLIGSSSDLISTTYLSSIEAKCLSFKIFKQQYPSDTLQLDIESRSGSRSTVWSQSVTNQQWVKVNVDLPPLDDNKLILSASRHSERSTPIAIDELAVSPEPCSSHGTCNFDYGLCDYTVKSGELLVGFGRLPDPSAISWTPLKNIDPYDLFVYTNTQKNDELVSYSLESPFNDHSQRKTCLSFSYALTFKQDGKFSIKLTSNETSDSKTIWSLDPAISEEKWKTMEIPLSDSGQFNKFSFEFSGVQLFAAIDDIVVDYCVHQETPVCFHHGLIDQKCIRIVPSAFNNWLFKRPHQLPINQSSDLGYKFKNDFVLFFDEPVDFRDISGFSYFYISNLKPNVEYCLKFWYSITGNIELKLWTYKMDSDFNQYHHKSPIITLNSHFGSNWDQAKIQLDDMLEKSKLIFGAKQTVNSQGTIIIEGIELTEGSCSIDYHYFCDFEGDCSWNNLDKDKSLIITGSGQEYKATTEWLSGQNPFGGMDITLVNEYGHVMKTKSDKGTAIFMFPPIYLSENTDEMCLTIFVYQGVLVGDGYGVDVITEQAGVIKLIEKASVDESFSWSNFKIPMKFNPNLSKVARVYLVGSAVEIDEISIKDIPCADFPFSCKNGTALFAHQVCDFIEDCPTGEDEINCGDCSFEYNFCGYIEDWKAEWFVKKSHASVGIEKISGIRHTDLTSVLLRPAAPTCKLQFNYENDHRKYTDLKVLLYLNNGNTMKLWDELMLKYIQNGVVEINLGRIPVPFKVSFLAHLASSGYSLSLGPVKFIDCGYKDTIDSFKSSEIFTCGNGRRIRQDKVCDLSIDCFDGDDELNCDNYRIYSFENSSDAEYWTNLSNEESKWRLAEAGEQGITMPTRDHSKGLDESHYMAFYPNEYLISQSKMPTESKLASPELTSVDNCSMVFYYNTAGVTLLVSLVDSDSNYTQLLELPSDDVFGFKRQHINLKKGDISVPFNFVFTARYSESDKGNYQSNYYAVIDDIVISDSCFDKSEDPFINITSDCPKNEFRCKTNVGDVCLQNDRLCDFNIDCLDGIDELYCGPCEFNNQSLCGWTNEGEDDWITFDKYKGNEFDAKIPGKNKPINFIVPEKRSNNLRAILKSQRLGKTSTHCRFNFTYFLADRATMTVRLRNDLKSSSKKVFDLDHTNEWKDKLLEVGSLDPGYYIQFVLDVEATDDTRVHGGLASFKLIDCDPHTNH